MPIDEGNGASGETIVRNRVNRVAGLVVQAILLGIWILNDPLEFQGPLPPDESASWAESVIVALIMGFVGMVSLVLFWYPYVKISPNQLTIYNPVSTVSVPKASIAEVNTDARHVRIRADGRWYRCWGLETSLWMQLTHNDKAWSSLLRSAVRSGMALDASEQAPRRQWRRLTLLEILVGCGWSALLILSMAYGLRLTADGRRPHLTGRTGVSPGRIDKTTHAPDAVLGVRGMSGLAVEDGRLWAAVYR